MTKRVYLRNFRQLQRALMTLGREGDRVARQTMRRKLGPFALSAIKQTSASTKPRPYASGTYERGWHQIKIDDGAAIVNSAKHTIFVEVGRRPGKRPPRKPIMAWVRHKRLAKPPRRKRGKPSANPTKRGTTKRGTTKRGKRKPTFRDRLRRMGHDELDDFVEAVRWKIAKRGTAGRFVVKRAMPKIRKQAIRMLQVEFNKLLRSGPR